MIKYSKLLSVAFILLFLSGCATTPSIKKMEAATENFQLPKIPEKGGAMIYVARPEMAGFAIRFNVFVDNKQSASEVGYTRGGQYIYFNVTPGEHQILSKAENWAEKNVSVKENEIIFLKQNVKIGVIMARNDLENITDLEGKYYAKTLSLGTIHKHHK